MNWKEALRRILIIFAVATVGIGTYVGWQNKAEIYEYRDEDGSWGVSYSECIPGTFQIAYLYDRDPERNYNYIGDCRTFKSVVVGFLAGLVPPLALLFAYFLLAWVIRGLKVEAPSDVELTNDGNLNS